MGNGRWDSTAWGTYSSTHVAGKTTAQVFTSKGMNANFDPAVIQYRESRDSMDNPQSTPVVLACDVTGSMGMIADQLIRDGLNSLATELQTLKPIPDPHVMTMAIGDANYDSAPLQVTQFEADIRIADQTRQLWLEKGGGINTGESYALAHLFAANKIVSDAWDKRKKKGYLFSIGDEPTIGISKAQAKQFLGIDIPKDLSPEECAKMAMEKFEVFHVILTNDGYASRALPMVMASWEPVLPQRLVLLDDISKLSETVVATIQIAEGMSKSVAASRWNTGTSVIVANAVRSLAERGNTQGAVRL